MLRRSCGRAPGATTGGRVGRWNGGLRRLREKSHRVLRPGTRLEDTAVSIDGLDFWRGLHEVREFGP